MLLQLTFRNVLRKMQRNGIQDVTSLRVFVHISAVAVASPACQANQPAKTLNLACTQFGHHPQELADPKLRVEYDLPAAEKMYLSIGFPIMESIYSS